MSANNRISDLVNSQSPFFVRNDHQNFVRFLEAYYEWLELPDNETDPQYNVINRIKRLQEFQNVDRSIDQFSEELYNTYLKLIPDEVVADKALILKNVKDFYLARGTEKSIKFLLRILFGETDTEFYYPKKDVLRASDGKWFIEKSVKFTDAFLNDVLVTDVADFQKFVGSKIVGEQTGATAFVERVDTYYDGEVLIRELKISNQTKDFSSGERISCNVSVNGGTAELSANVLSGIITSVKIDNPGRGYRVGDPVEVVSNTGSGAVLVVGEVTESTRDSDIKSFFINSNGAGFQVNATISIVDTTGSGATANVLSVDDSGRVHPNSYNIVSSIISLEANTQIANLTYSNLNSSNANTTLANALSFFTLSGLGPLVSTLVLTGGNNYTTFPTISVQANTRLKDLGILGSMEIVDGGQNYQIGDTIEFINVMGGFGSGSLANVRNVDAQASNAINEVGFVEVYGQITGGSGYEVDKLPTANVISLTGNGAVINVKTLLGYGDDLKTLSDVSGRVQKISVIKTGSGYLTPPTLGLANVGDGTAQATATIVTGAYSYPGRWLNDDGQLSGYNFLQDRDYYQNFSYVVKTKQSIEKYRKYLKDLLHPAGLKLFGEYVFIDTNDSVQVPFKGTNTENLTFVTGTYTAVGNNFGTTIEVATLRYTGDVANVVVEFLDGDTANIANGFFVATPNSFVSTNLTIYQSSYTNVNTSNLTVNTGQGTSVSTINLSSSSSNSNVVIRVGYRINVNNEIVTINSISSNTLVVTPGLSGNLISNTLVVMVPSVHANVTNSTGNLIISI
jgi:hypothetical protein